jgi:hypothetical protein
MAYEIIKDPSQSVILDWTAYTDLYGSFCGPIDYTLTYSSGPICSAWNSADSNCVKSKALLVFDETNTKFIIDPSSSPLRTGYNIFDHSLLGVHNF